jgi:hypothetical protein
MAYVKKTWVDGETPILATDLNHIETGIYDVDTGKYAKPNTGIPKTDLASAVQTSLGKADTALQSYTETDPVFIASAAHGITSSNISNWNSKQDALVSGTNIKTINNTSILGSGNLTIETNEWVYLGTATGQTKIALPTGWKELRCIVLFDGSTTRTGQTFILKGFTESPISATQFGVTCSANGGGAGSASVYAGNVRYYPTTNEIAIEYAPGVTNSSKLYVYYR